MKINDYFTEVIGISILGSTNLNSKFSVQFRVYVMIFPPWKKGENLTPICADSGSDNGCSMFQNRESQSIF